MKFFIDEMFPSSIAISLAKFGHDATSPAALGALAMSDRRIIELCMEEERVLVTENIRDFAQVADCSILLVLKVWWPGEALELRLTRALQRWALANPTPGRWPQWLDSDYR
jgi:hypothetical protein